MLAPTSASMPVAHGQARVLVLALAALSVVTADAAQAPRGSAPAPVDADAGAVPVGGPGSLVVQDDTDSPLALLKHPYVQHVAAETPAGATRSAKQPAPAAGTAAVPRIAVIGAGAAGASFTYFLKRFSAEGRFGADVTVFDRESRIGGRAHVLPLTVDVCDPQPAGKSECRKEDMIIELGASIFAKANAHMVNASREFGLEFVDRSSSTLAKERYASFGVWDGAEWHYLETPPSGSSSPGWGWFGSWVSSFKMLYKYGFFNGPIQASSIARGVARDFIKVYGKLERNERFEDVVDLVNELGVRESVETRADQYMADRKISSAFIQDIFGGITRNTYLQDTDSIRAFGGLIALFSGVDEMYTVKGGNYKVFEGMLAGSDVRLASRVDVVAKTKTPEGKPEFHIELSNGEKHTFDMVVLAAPLPASSIDFRGINLQNFPIFKYVRLYVTVVVGELNPAFFGLQRREEIPITLLTSSPSHESVPFNCMSILRAIDETRVVTKMFSRLPLSEKQLDAMFVSRSQTARHAWERPGSYPLLPPVDDQSWSLKVVVDTDGLYYANSFEGFISTMETETIAGRNVAGLVADRISKRK
ncbi:hypothetical protein HK105_205548 [Polyrhizophydium stewartii]|uniref:Prenylcysteine lyase domain-containing protein n=1 Tax=Polyrhizophydium stewartii TaxID=2732419 RepID=A0ABR4N6B4_9FUNG